MPKENHETVQDKYDVQAFKKVMISRGKSQDTNYQLKR
jgi:hypothetical protein